MKELKSDQCHVDVGPFCRIKPMIDMPREYVRAFIAYTELHNPTIRSDDECVRKALFPDYAEARKIIPIDETIDGTMFTIYLLLGVGGVCVVILFITGVLIFIKLKQAKAAEGEDDDEDTET